MIPNDTIGNIYRSEFVFNAITATIGATPFPFLAIKRPASSTVRFVLRRLFIEPVTNGNITSAINPVQVTANSAAQGVSTGTALTAYKKNPGAASPVCVPTMASAFTTAAYSFDQGKLDRGYLKIFDATKAGEQLLALLPINNVFSNTNIRDAMVQDDLNILSGSDLYFTFWLMTAVISLATQLNGYIEWEEIPVEAN